MGALGLIVVGIVLILFWKLFFGTEDERRGCWQNVGCGIVSAVILFFWFAHLLNSPQTSEPRADAPSDGKVFGIVSRLADAEACAGHGITHTGRSLLLTSVVTGSGAQQAGLPSSIIVEVDGYAPDSQDLVAVKSRHNLGDMVPFKLVTNDGNWWTYWVRLGGA